MTAAAVTVDVPDGWVVIRGQKVMALADPPGWGKAIDDWCAFLRAGGRPETTIYLRRYQLRRIGHGLRPAGPWDVTTDTMIRWLSGKDWRSETRRSFRSCLRSFYRWAVAAGRLDVDPTFTLPPVPVAPGVPRPAADHLIRFAIAGSDNRVRLMILLGAVCGLRRTEIARVHTDDVAGGSLRVRGKGDRVRNVPLPPVVAQAIAPLPRGWVFPGRIDGHVSPAHAGKLISRALEPGVTAHMLRHRFASTAYAAERDLRAVQTLLGHTKPETTAIYTAVPDGALLAAVTAAAMF